MDKVTLKIDGRPVTVPPGTTVLAAAHKLGISIPVLCHHPKLTVTGACRVCIVEINGQPVTSCSAVAQNGMEVTTASPYIEGLRRDIVDLILSDHPYDCMVCERAGDCELQELAYKYQIRTPVFGGERRTYPKRDGNPFIEREMEKCILCGRCVKICDEVQGVGAIDYAYKGFGTKICPPFERDLNCEFCGQCVMVCPTGALSGKQWTGKGRYWHIREVDTICPLLRRRLLHYAACKGQRDRARHGQGRPGRKRRAAVRQGPLRIPVRVESRPTQDASDTKERRTCAGNVGGGVGVHGNHAAEDPGPARSRRDRGPVVGPLHHRRQLSLPEIHARSHRHEQRGPLRASLTRAHGGQFGHHIRLRRHDQLAA